MQAGGLDRRVMLLRATVSRNALNEPEATFHPMAGMPASGISARREPVSDGERLRAQQLGGSVTDRFTIRWAKAWSDLNPNDELEFEGRRYGIVAVKEIGRRRGIEITAVARAEGRA